MDAATKGFWDKIVRELEHLNKTLNSFLETVERPRQQYNPANENQNDSTGKSDPASGKLLLGFELGPSPKHQHASPQKWYKSFEWWKSRLEVATYIFAIAYAVTTGYIAYINYHQWQDLRHNFEVDERSWIRLAYEFPTPTLNQPVAINTTFTNSGKSIVTMSFEIGVLEILDANAAPSLSLANGFNNQTAAPIFQNDHGGFPIWFRDEKGGIEKFTQSEIDGLASGKMYIAAFGYIMYWDQFGKHWLRYCNWKGYAPNAYVYARSCTGWNTTGDGDPPDKEAARYNP